MRVAITIELDVPENDGLFAGGLEDAVWQATKNYAEMGHLEESEMGWDVDTQRYHKTWADILSKSSWSFKEIVEEDVI